MSLAKQLPIFFRPYTRPNCSCPIVRFVLQNAVPYPCISQLFLPFPLSASSLRCVCVAHSLSLVAQVVQSVEKHTLGTRFCHIMFLFGLLIPQHNIPPHGPLHASVSDTYRVPEVRLGILETRLDAQVLRKRHHNVTVNASLFHGAEITTSSLATTSAVLTSKRAKCVVQSCAHPSPESTCNAFCMC